MNYLSLLAEVPAGAPNPILSFLPMIVMFAVFYFLLIQPQQKRQKELNETVKNLKKGDRIVTSGGLIGTIVGIQDDYLVIKAGEGEAKLEVLKSAVTGKR